MMTGEQHLGSDQYSMEIREWLEVGLSSMKSAASEEIIMLEKRDI